MLTLTDTYVQLMQVSYEILSGFVQGGVFQTAVYNQTVTITEPEEGLDGETWAFLCADFRRSD